MSAWRQYRGWAASSRRVKAQLDRQSKLTLGFALATAALAACASLPKFAGLRAICAFASACTGAAAGWFGQYVFDPKAQQYWIAARAAAEALQSECYRFAARSGDYSSTDAVRRFVQQVRALPDAADKVGAPYDAKIAAGQLDKLPPDDPLDVSRYRDTRLAQQLKWYTENSAAEFARANRGRWLVGTVAGAGVGLGVLTAILPDAWTAPFIGMTTAFAAAVAAYGAIERHQFLYSTYSGIARQLSWLSAQGVPDTDLVASAEDLLTAEHRAWANELSRTAK